MAFIVDGGNTVNSFVMLQKTSLENGRTTWQHGRNVRIYADVNVTLHDVPRRRAFRWDLSARSWDKGADLQTDNMILLTKGPVSKQRIDTFTGSESLQRRSDLSPPCERSGRGTRGRQRSQVLRRRLTLFTGTAGTKEYDAISLSTAAARRSPDANSRTRSFQKNWSVSAGEPAHKRAAMIASHLARAARVCLASL